MSVRFLAKGNNVTFGEVSYPQLTDIYCKFKSQTGNPFCDICSPISTLLADT